jgi:hypothetical protein
MNRPLFKKVLDHIKENPQEWNQLAWNKNCKFSCGTDYCFAGNAELMAGFSPIDPDNTRFIATRALGLGNIEAMWLFNCRRTILDFGEFYQAGGMPNEQS